MKKSNYRKGILIGVGVIIVALVLYYNFVNVEEITTPAEEQKAEAAPVVNNVQPPTVPSVIDYSAYHWRYVDEGIKSKLTSMIGGGKTAFYLPPTGYINVSRGGHHGVPFALNNPNPSGNNYFVYEYTSDASVVESCGVTQKVADSWITSGWGSEGKIPKGWVDHMTVYFEFPSDAPVCNIKYNFKITKDGAVYDTAQLEFNIV